MTRASSNRKTKAASVGQSSNVIMLPVGNLANLLAVQPMLFAGDDLPDMPPWLIEDIKPVDANPTVTKAPVKKKVAAKKMLAKRERPAKAKPAPKKRDVAKRNKPIVTEAQPMPEVQPLTRSMAPVVWKKNSPLAALRYWLRSAGRNVVDVIAPAKRIGPRLRSRRELLLEIAVLRQENATMRKKLNLPAMPFGRTVADCV